MNKKIAVVVLVVLALLVLKRCDHKKVEEISDEKLKPGDRSAIIVDGRTGEVTVIKRPDRGRSVLSHNGRDTEADGAVLQRIDGARGIRVTVDEKGKPTITARTSGFSFEPGIGILAADGYPRGSLDFQLYFVRRHGVNAGISYPLRGRGNLRLYVAYSYTPKILSNNTSLLVGLDSNKQITAGLRVRF